VFSIVKKVAGQCHQKKLGGVGKDLRKKGADRGGRSMQIRQAKGEVNTPGHHFFVDGLAQWKERRRAGENVWEPAGSLIAERALAKIRNAIGKTSASRPTISERSKDQPREKGRRAGAQHIKSLNDGAARER
jgi:hypothetical protein